MDDLWCDNCAKSHEGLCKNRGALHKVEDAVIPSRARLTLPPSLTLKPIKEDGKQGVSVFTKKPIPVRCQFGPFDAPVISRTMVEKKSKQETTVWKKKNAMQKAMETSGQSHSSENSEINTSASDVQSSPVLPSQAMGPQKVPQSIGIDSAGLQTTDIAISSLQHQLMSMSSHNMAQSGVDLHQTLNQLPLQSSPVHNNSSLTQLQQTLSLQDFTPIGFPSPSGTMQLQVTPENIQQLHQHVMQYGHQQDLTQLTQSIPMNNGYPPTSSINNQSLGTVTENGGHVMINLTPPTDLASQTTEDSGVADTSHANMSDSMNADENSDSDLDEGSEQDFSFELKVITHDGYMETLDMQNENYCNWMIFVRPAKLKAEQNLVAYQEDGCIFYVSLKPIPANTELKVWYSQEYAKSINKAMLPEEESKLDDDEEDDDKLFCPACNLLFVSKAERDSHPCVGKGKGRRKGRPRKYVKPTKTWRAKLEKSRLKESQSVKTPSSDSNKTTPQPRRGRGRPRVKPVEIIKLEPEKVEIIPEIKSQESPQQLLMVFEADDGDDYDPGVDQEQEQEEEDELLDEKKLVIKEKKKRGPKSTRAPMQCPHCSESFVAEAMFYIHVYKHTGVKPFICDVPDCARGFLSKFKLERHRLIHTSPRHHKCPYCDKSFNRKDHLKNHMTTHDPNKRIWKCEICGKEYSYSFSYRTHIAFHAAERGETLSCGICKKTFDTKEALLFHLKVHTGARAAKNSTEKTHPCFDCGKKFFTRKDVKRHMITHTKRKDFLCQFCPQRFGRKDHLTRHLRTSHTGDNQNNGGRVRRSTGDSTSPVKRRDRTLMFEKMEPTMVPLQMTVPTAIQDDIQDQLLAGVTNVSQATANIAGSQATLLQNLQYAVSQIPVQPGQPREIQIPAAIYEAAAAAAAQQQQEQQQQAQAQAQQQLQAQQQAQQQAQSQQQQVQQTQQVQQVAVASINNVQPVQAMPALHTSMAAHYQINDKGYVMNTGQAEQAIVRQIQVAPSIDYRNITQALQGNMYITTANPQVLQTQQQLQQQPQQQQVQVAAATPQQNILSPTKIEPQTLEISRNNGITTLQQPAEYQLAARQVVETVNTAVSAVDQTNRTPVVMASAVDPRQTSHPQTYPTTLLGFVETLRFLENLPTSNTAAIQLQQLQGLNIENSQAQTAQILPAAYNTSSVAGNSILNINQADLAKGVVAISPHAALQLDMKNMVSLAQSGPPALTHHVYQQQPTPQQAQHQS